MTYSHINTDILLDFCHNKFTPLRILMVSAIFNYTRLVHIVADIKLDT